MPTPDHLATSIELSIGAKPALQEPLASDLAEIGATGFVNMPSKLLAYFTEQSLDEAALHQILEAYGVSVNERKALPPQNWNALWESNLEPVDIEGFAKVVAPFHEIDDASDVECIRITPNMAFGTGHHETTRLMVRMMHQSSTGTWVGTKVLDMGCGSGILGIYALKLGAGHVAFVDYDPITIQNSKENLNLNALSWDTADFEVSETPPVGRQYDRILANINRNAVLAMSAELAAVVSPHGRLLVSGFLEQDAADVRRKFESLGLSYAMDLQEGKWQCMMFRNPSF